ncbi:MAG: AAA family ATPase [Candidatus Cloacimonetes bacterium]|nr:AAA family ATPase [Candidatus Cloacimonadota bacterium]
MRIEEIRLQNYKCYKKLKISRIPAMAVFVGANGTGKSTLFDVFGFLKHCLTYNVNKAVQSRGGFQELVSREHRGETIIIEIKFRLNITGVERLVTYYLEIAEIDKSIIVNREILRYKRGAHGSPYHFLDYKAGKGYAITNEEDFTKENEELTKEYRELEANDILAIKGLGQFQKFKAANAFRNLIENWHLSDFHINKARGTKDAVGYDEHLSVSGDNLQLVAHNLFLNHKDIFQKIIKKMQERVPGISSIEPETTVDGRLLLKFQDGSFKDPFIDKYVSDGTIKMFAYLVMLFDPHPHPLLCVEEPENQLYPHLLTELAEEFRLYSRHGDQVFVSTHSPDFLNAMELEEVFWLEKRDGFTEIKRASDDEQISAYMLDGDKMGYLWKQGFLGRVNPK